VIGVERSGTSWLAEVLRSTPGTVSSTNRITPTRTRLRVARSKDSAVTRWWRATSPARTRTGGCGRPPSVAHRSTSSGSIGSRSASFGPRIATIASPRVIPSIRGSRRDCGWRAGLAVPKHSPDQAPTHIVKTVRAHFAFDWGPHELGPFGHRVPPPSARRRRELAQRRDPPKLDWLGPAARAQAQLRYGVVEPSTTDPIASMACRTGLLMSVLDEHVRDHPEVHVAQHEYLCDAPVERMRDLVTSIGLRGHPPPRASSPSTNGRVRASSSTGWRPSSRASGAPVCPTTTRAARRA
jgi:hypothetical protein